MYRSSRQLMLALALLLWASSAAAQEGPRVENLSFEGVEAFGEDNLRRSIVTEETRCRGGFLLRPICRLTGWGGLITRAYLDPRELPRDELRLATYYHLRGFREAAVSSEVFERANGAVDIVFRIDEGEPTLLESLELTQEREVLSRRQIRRTGLPEPGGRLDLVALDTALAGMASRLGAAGYLDAVIRDTVEIVPDARLGRVEIRVEPGGRSTIGEVRIEGNENVDDGTIRNSLRLREGRVLRSSDIVASQRSLYESNLFHEARVTLPPQPDTVKRLAITVREAPQRGARVGGGFNTSEFLQVEGRLTHYNFLGDARRVDLRATVGNLLADQLNGRGFFRQVLPETGGLEDELAFLDPTWLASLEVMQPSFITAQQRVGANVFAHRRLIPGIVVDEGMGGELSVTRRVDFGAATSLSYRFESTAIKAGDLYFCINFAVCDVPTISLLRARHTLSPVALSFVEDRSNDPISATEGYRIRLDLEHASGPTLSDFRYNRISGAGAYYHPLDARRTRILAGRLRFGWVDAMGSTAEAIGIDGDIALLHPRKRFYSGGSRSVRGFWENQLGPQVLTIDPDELLGTDAEIGGDPVENDYCTPAQLRDGTCDPAVAPSSAFVPRPLGGSTVLEGNIEYRFPGWFGFTWVLFVDGATVGDGLGELWSGGTAAITPGAGIRTMTPVGPVRVDLGFRPRLVQELPVYTEVVDDDGLRELVRLETPLRYDPIEDPEAGVFGKVLRRLRLHVSIGEAF